MLVSVSLLSLTLLYGGGTELPHGSTPPPKSTSSTLAPHEPVV